MKTIQPIHVKIGDRVKVISGKQKGFIGSISEINKKESTVIIKELSLRIKYIKNREGVEAIKVELPINIHSSNVMLWDSSINKPSRIGYKVINNEKKRYFKKSGNLV